MSDQGRLLFDKGLQARRRQAKFAAVAAALAILCLVFGVGHSQQLALLDTWFGIKESRPASSAVVIVGIDGRSTAVLGRPPWSRGAYVDVIDRISAAGAKVIAFDFTFQVDPREQEESEKLAAAMKRAGNVVFGMVFNDLGDPSPPGRSARESVYRNALPALEGVPIGIPSPGFEEPQAVIAEAAAAIGHVNALNDVDGKLRSIPLLIRHGEQIYPSFAVQIARLQAGVELDEIRIVDGALEIDYARIPMNDDGEVLLNWPNTELQYKTVSFIDVHKGEVDDHEFKDKAVLIAGTLEGFDERTFPFGDVLKPGVLMHATLLDNIFTAKHLSSPGWVTMAEYGVTLLLAILAVGLFPRLTAKTLLIAVPIAIVVLFVASLAVFLVSQIWAPPLYPALALLLPMAITAGLKLRETEDVTREAVDDKLEAEKRLALSYQEKGLLDMALAAFGKLPMTQDMKGNYLSLGIDFLNRGLKEKAFLAFKRVYDVDPNYEDVAHRLEAVRLAGAGTHVFANPTVQVVSPAAPTVPVNAADAIGEMPTVAGGPAGPDDGEATVAFGATGGDDGEEATIALDVPTLSGHSATVSSAAGAPGVPVTPASASSLSVPASVTDETVVTSVGSRFGRYEIVAKLGRGAMGEVYKVKDTRIGRIAAMKTVRRDLDVSPAEAIQLRQRFYREAETAGNLSHPNVVTIHDVGEEQGIGYIVMEFIEGQTLTDIRIKGDLTEEKIKYIIYHAALGLQHAHEHGVFHRDVKPDNIMVNKDGVVKVMDFGIARLVESDMTRTGTTMGTPSYMSPEQFSGKVDARSDVYSLGVVLYQLLTGQNPFLGATPTEVLMKVLQSVPPPPSAMADGVRPEWDAIVARALAKKAEDRYQTAREFGDIVKAVGTGS